MHAATSRNMGNLSLAILIYRVFVGTLSFLVVNNYVVGDATADES